MHKLKIATSHPSTVAHLLQYYELVSGSFAPMDPLDSPLGLVVSYPDDLLSQALTFWFAMAQGCGLIDWYEFRGRRGPL